jgi:hypothetical protein
LILIRASSHAEKFIDVDPEIARIFEAATHFSFEYFSNGSKR